MKSFTNYLRRSMRADPDWSAYYVDYGKMKATLRTFSTRRHELRDMLESTGGVVTRKDLNQASEISLVRSSSDIFEEGGGFSQAGSVGSSNGYVQYVEQATHNRLGAKDAMRRLSAVERTEFCKLLDEEVGKAARFYEKQLAHLEESVPKLYSKPTGHTYTSRWEEEFEAAGDEILELLAFVVVNMITLRQILIRYDGFVRTFNGLPLSDWYVQRRDVGDSSGCRLQDLFHLRTLFDMEISFTLHLQERKDWENVKEDDVDHPMSTYSREFTSGFNQLRQLLRRTLASVEEAAGGHRFFSDHIISTLRHYFLLGSITTSLSLELSFLLMRGKTLSSEMRLIAKWRETRKLSTEIEEEPKFGKMRKENIFPLVLNLVSCFLFVVNGYIIEPSSAYYVEALGSNEALAGMLIGVKQWAALFSAVGFSFWTNYSYKQPLLLSGLFLVVGNMMYACAYSYHSITMCLLGRFVTGFGAPRIINRRYIADATPFSLRTIASAAFAMASAVGAAMGPGAAIFLDMFNFEFYLPVLGKQYFNGMTGPGFFMAFLWTVNTLVILLTFTEPNRSGIEELRRREAADKSLRKGVLESSKGEVIESVTSGKDSELGIDHAERVASKGTYTPNNTNGGMPLRNALSDATDGYDSDQSDSYKLSELNHENTLSVCYCFKHMTRAVILCMTLIFFKRISLESIVASTSIVTKNRYGWTIKNVGTLHFVNGILVIPVSIMAGWLSQYYEDRYLTVWFLSFSLLGLLVLLDFSDFVSTDNDGFNEDHWLAVGPAQYIVGSLMVFSSIEACESFVASLMSKIVPSALATGTFNSGLLTTLVGVGGRASGDVVVTVCGFISLRNLLNLVVLPSTVMMFLCISSVLLNYDSLAA